MTTYLQIQKYVQERYGYEPKTCWIAHVKEMCGLPVRTAHNRMGERLHPCPENKIDSIKDAFSHFGIF